MRQNHSLRTCYCAYSFMGEFQELDAQVRLPLIWPSFKGTNDTFGGFPDRLKHILTETIENTTVECIVFPAYEVCPLPRGPELHWLTFASETRPQESWCESFARSEQRKIMSISECCGRKVCRLVDYTHRGKGSGSWYWGWSGQGENRAVWSQVRGTVSTPFFMT